MKENQQVTWFKRSNTTLILLFNWHTCKCNWRTERFQERGNERKLSFNIKTLVRFFSFQQFINNFHSYFFSQETVSVSTNSKTLQHKIPKTHLSRCRCRCSFRWFLVPSFSSYSSVREFANLGGGRENNSVS